MKRTTLSALSAVLVLSCGSDDDLWSDANAGVGHDGGDLHARADASSHPDGASFGGDSGGGGSGGGDAGPSGDSGNGHDPGSPPDSGGLPVDSGAFDPICTFGAPHDGDGSFTWYYFGQGTGRENGYYVTACGYRGTESSSAGQSAIDDVLDVASAGGASSRYFVAIPSASSSNFDTVNECGACVELAHGATRIIATVVDACPKDSNAPCLDPGHLDISTQAFDALGYSVGNPSNTTWRRVACPITGSIRARLKNGNTDQMYLTNTVFPIVRVTYQGQTATHLSYGAWQLPGGASASGAALTLSDVEGHTVTGIVPPGGGELGAQFPAPSSCP